MKWGGGIKKESTLLQVYFCNKYIFCEDNFLKRNIRRRKQKSNEDFELAALWVFCIHLVVSKSSQNSGVKLKYSSPITLEVHLFYVCACMHTHAHVDTHTSSKFCHACQHLWNTSLEMVHRLAVTLNLSTVTKCGPRSPIFIVGDNRKSQGERSDEYGGCGMNVIATVIAVWFGVL